MQEDDEPGGPRDDAADEPTTVIEPVIAADAGTADEAVDGTADASRSPASGTVPASDDSLRAPRLIVGVGASAGGLESLERLFTHVPGDAGFAFVVVQHLSPHHKSLMVELLARRTGLDVRTATHGATVRRDTIHLLPPGKQVTLIDGRLVLEDQANEQPHLPIDRFFHSLARDATARAVAIVLSGTGADGSRGIADVKSLGGLVLAETEVTAKFSGMPDSAVATGSVDHSLAPEEIVEVLLAHANRFEEPPPETVLPARGTPYVLTLLRERYGIDFTQYKAATIERRIERRIGLGGVTRAGIDDYVERLERDHEELDVLYHDLLIGVTRFFRDQACFERLELEGLPRLFAGLRPGQPLRVWVAGCATGEEAYTVAMLIEEQLDGLGDDAPEVKVFATDLHQGALARAARGIYPAEALEHVSGARRARHFEPHEEGYRVADAVRRHVVFARHDLLSDAPFTRLDLVTCRNLLIYFDVPAQQKALRLFHFALKLGGVLLLGPSETLGPLVTEYATIDESCRLFRKARDSRLPEHFRFDSPMSRSTPAPSAGTERGERPETRIDPRLLNAYDTLLDRHMPPGVLLDARGRVVDSFAGAATLLHHPARRPEGSFLDALKTPASDALREAVRRARADGERSTLAGVELIDAGGRARHRDVTIEPLGGSFGSVEHVLLTFAERRPSSGDPVDDDASDASDEPDPAGARAVAAERTEGAEDAGDDVGLDPAAHREIEALRDRLQRTIELADASGEELQATNEELISANEELQSSNEELNSVNEELHTVNVEYQSKIAEFRELSEDMNHLLASTDIGTLFLDRELRVRRFTPGVERAYDLTAGDTGRPITTFSHRLDIERLDERLREVIRDGRTFEQEVRDAGGQAILLRLLPYRVEEQVDGVVMTLVDIGLLDDARAALADSESSLQRRVAELQTLYATAPAGLCFIDRRYRYARANERMAEIDGVPLESYRGRRVEEVLPKPLAERVTGILGGLFESGEPMVNERFRAITGAHPDEARDYLVNYYPVRDTDGEIVGCSCVVIALGGENAAA